MKLFRLFWPYLRRYTAALVALFLITIPLYGLASTGIVALTGPIFGEVLLADSNPLTGAAADRPDEPVDGFSMRALTDSGYRALKSAFSIDDHRVVWFVPILFSIVFLLRSLAAFVNGYAFQHIGLGVTNGLRNDLYRRMLYQSSAFHARHPSGELLTRVLSDVGLIQMAVTSRLLDLVQQSVALVLLLALLLSTHLQLALISLVGAPVIVVVIARFGRAIRKISHRSQRRLADVSRLLGEGVRGHRVVKAFGAEEFEARRFRKATKQHLRTSRFAQLFNSLSSPVVETMTAAGLAALLIYSGLRIRSGELSTPMLVQFIVNLMMLSDPIRKLNKVNLVLQQARAGAERLGEILDAPNDVVEKPDAVEVDGVHENVRFEEVHFAYGSAPDDAVLRGIDLEIPRGETVALVGPSGAGKSTLVGMLPRFFDPTAGRVTIDGRDIRDIRLRSLRNQISLVTQETVLFDDTIRNNIAYGRADLPIERVRAAARAAFAEDFIDAQPDGFDTLIGEAGTRLSGGQRQRLSIARAILKDAPILILDEATSHLDSESEALVQKALDNLMQNRTTLVVAHRLATVRRAHRIVVMDAGRIVEIGTHDELRGREGLYRKLYDLQFQDLGEAS